MAASGDRSPRVPCVVVPEAESPSRSRARAGAAKSNPVARAIVRSFGMDVTLVMVGLLSACTVRQFFCTILYAAGESG